MVSITQFKVGDVVGFCPNCNHELVIRKGRFGKFIGCTNYPNCTKTFDYKDFRVQQEAIVINELMKQKIE